MKNVIMVDIDTEREEALIIRKENDFVAPESKEEILKVVMLDVSTLVCGIKDLINSHMEIGLANSVITNIQADLAGFKDELNKLEEKENESN